MHLRNLVPLLGICLLLATQRAHSALSPVNNIDILEPIVRSSPALSEPDNDYFGWATVLHQIQTVNTGDNLEQAVANTRIIVGAPLGTFPGGLNISDPFQPRVEQTGLVYSCPIAPGQCDGVRGDTSVYLYNESIANNNGDALSTNDVLIQSFIEGRLFDQAPNAQLIFTSLSYGISENKSGQLLGSTLFSNGDTFIACAPRWTDSRGNALIAEPRGACYYSGRDLTGFRRLRPCDTMGATDEPYCLGGKSAIEFMNYFILGTPGVNEGRGALFYSTSANREVFTRGNTEQRPPEDDIRDQYQGFVTIPAYITRARTTNSPNIVTTVPRFDDDTYTGRINVYNPPTFTTFLTTVVAQGSQMGEFFGYSMIAVDINNDNFDDLVIGAPMNTDYTNLLIERGRIYIFINSGSGTFMNRIILDGRAERGRFGTSLANLGDINNDGYEDFAVGAPYERGTNLNTGAVYVYYGSADPSSLSSQAEFKISANDIVNRVSASGLNRLRTFGWSLSSGVDVDNNEYRDLVVGAYESQTVFLLRTLPVATVTVDIMPVPEVNLISSSFMVTVSASYTGRGIPGPIRVPFVLSENMSQSSAPRLTFANNGAGFFVLNGPGQTDTQMVSVTPLINTTSLTPYTLRLELQDIERQPRPNFDGNQDVLSLSAFPRLIQQGNNTEQVAIRNPCGNDGCRSDVMLHPPTRNITVISGGMTYHDTDLSYQHIDGEDAVGLNFILNKIPTSFISGVTIVRQGASPSETPCSSINSTGFATCNLQPRLQPQRDGMISVNFTVNQTALIGVQGTFSVDVEIVLQTEDPRDVDTDTENNDQQIVFDVETRADISVEQLSFGGASFNYTSMVPTERIMSTVSLGQSVTLRVDIRNSGPSIIGDGSVNISLPYRIMNSRFTLLYPTRIQDENSGNGLIQCEGTVDPDNIDRTSSQTSESRRKRMAEGFRSRRNVSPSSLKRVSRQVDGTQAVNCVGPDADPNMCAMISCRIRNLRPGLFTVSVFTRIDQRFFSDKATIYRLTASASVSVSEDIYGDRPENNNGQVVVTLMPMPADTTGESQSDIIHFILWPCIGGIILLILVAVLLYFVGFFRRKKKVDEGAIEGDFDVDQFNLKQPATEGEVAPPEGPEAPEASAPAQNSEDITTKV